MKKLIAISIVASTLAACSSAPSDPYERRAYEERERPIAGHRPHD